MHNAPSITLPQVRQRIAQLKREIADLEAAERVLLAMPAAATVEIRSAIPVGQPGNGATTTIKGKRNTLLFAISAELDGLTTQEAIEAGKKLGLVGLTISNVSPKLSFSKQQGLLTLEDGRWRITPDGMGHLAAEMKRG